MVLPAKIFEIKEEADIELIAGKLKRFREEELYQTKEKEKITLVTEILDLKRDGDALSGVFSKDFIRQRLYRRELVETPMTEEAPFWVKPFRQRLFLIVQGPSVARGVKKLLTNSVANRLSIADTTLYRDYMKHGQIWYAVFEAQKQGIVVGITRNTVITSFSKSSTEELMNYILEDLLKLIE